MQELVGIVRQEQEMLQALRDFDTPSITNVVATYPANPLCLGLYNPWTENWYTDQSIRCMYPELGRTVGYAVTCVYGLPDPGFNRLTFMDVIDALDAMPARDVERLIATVYLYRSDLRVRHSQRLGQMFHRLSLTELDRDCFPT